MSLRDCLNREVQVGDVIAYPARRGSALWMNTGRIIAHNKRYTVGDLKAVDELLVQRLPNLSMPYLTEHAMGLTRIRELGRIVRVHEEVPGGTTGNR